MSNVARLPAALLGGVLLLSCGACSQPWRFARADYSIPGAQPPATSSYAAQDTVAVPGRPPQTGLPSYVTADPPGPWERSQASAASFDSFSGAVPEAAAGVSNPGPVFGSPGDPAFATAVPVLPDAAWARPGFGTRLRSDFRELTHDIGGDYRNHYGWTTMRDLWLGVGAAAALANTSLDDDFQGWYQRDVRSPGTDDFAAFWKTFGEGQIFIPAYAGLALVGGIFEDRPLIGPVGEFGERVTRGYLVGAPPMIFMQYLLGASRPGESGVGSQWKPFDDSNSLSGHAFIGAVPFITAAKMSRSPWAKATFYTLSTFPAWSRVNDDAHYLSQACLGWGMAYLACRAVDDTEHADRSFTFTPLITPQITGLAMEYRR